MPRARKLITAAALSAALLTGTAAAAATVSHAPEPAVVHVQADGPPGIPGTYYHG